MHNKDKILLNRLSADETAFADIFTLHYKRLVLEAYYLLKDEQEAKDLVQEVFIELWNKKQWTNISSLKSYLNQSVRNRYYNYIKSENVQEKRKSAYLYLENLSGNNVADPGVENNDQRDEKMEATLHQTLQYLSPKAGRIFHLYYLQNKSRNEVALEVGVSINTVKTVLSRGLTFLRTKLK